MNECWRCNGGMPCSNHDINWRGRRPRTLDQFDNWRTLCSDWYEAYLFDSRKSMRDQANEIN